MTNREMAEEIAKSYLFRLGHEIGEELVVSSLREEDFGWVFFYQSKEHIETGDVGAALAGNSPFIVKKNSFEVVVLGTSESLEKYIAEYRSK